MHSSSSAAAGFVKKTREFTSGAYEIFLHLCSFAAGFCLAQSSIFENYSPFGMAFAAALPKNYTLGAAVGAAAGYLVLKAGDMPLRYMAALVVITVVSYAVKSGKRRRMQGLLLSLTVFAAAFFTGLAVSYARGLTVGDTVMFAAEGVMAGGSAYIFHSAAEVLSRGKFAAASRSEKLFTAAAACLIFMGLSGVAFFGVAPARILAVIIILFAAKFRKETGGAAVGASLGAVTAFIPGCAHLAAAYPAGGLIAGAFSGAGKFVSAGAFAAVSAMVSAALAGASDSLPALIETAAATIIFVLIPERKTESLRKKLSPVKNEAPTGAKKALIMRLDVASAAMNEVSACVEKVTEKLGDSVNPDITAVYTEVQLAVCRQCGMRSFCWDKSFDDTVNVFNDMVYFLRDEGEIKRENLPPHFIKRCIRLALLTETLSVEYEKYVAGMTARRSINRVRSIVSDQFCAVADMLESLAAEFEQAHSFDAEAAVRVEGALALSGIEPREISCVLDPFGRMNIEAYCKKTSGKISAPLLTQDVSAACGREMLTPGVTQLGEEELLTFSERAEFTVRMGAAQYPACEDEPCGDAYEYFTDGRGRQIMIISDGMGTGARAAVDGAMAAGLIAKLIRAGFGFDSALKTVNSALLVKSAEESFATLDIVCLDLFSGEADFLKAGAPATFVRRSGKAAATEKASLPAGILRETQFARSRAQLGAGDIILMVSDGVISGSFDWILSEMELWRGADATELAEHIAREAARRRIETRADDITVLAAIVGR